MSRKKSQKQIKLEKEKERLDTKRRFFHPNLEARRFCFKNDFTIYPHSQAKSQKMVKLFMQKGTNFKPISDKLYNQDEPKDVMQYVADIDRKYEEMYLKMKDKVTG